MLPVASVIVDFDGTACLHDVAVHVLERFGDPVTVELDAASARGEIPVREVIERQAATLAAPLEEMVAFVAQHCPLDPTFRPFVGWLREHDVDVAIASDGFGFYIKPILAAAGVPDIPIITNTWSGAGLFAYDRGHAECVGCGTCKINAVFDARARGRVAYVGDGGSDRFAALYADLVFAQDDLVEIATRDGVPFVPWDDFDDVRRRLESTDALPGPVEPARCPGWTLA